MEQIEKIQGTEKEFIKVFQELCYSRSSWQVWADLMAAMACTLANSVDKTEPRHTAREKEYAEFLTKNPKRYTQYGVPSGKGNMWYGTTVTNSEDMERIYQLPNLLNTFASIEPLLEDIDENISALKYLNWIIIGAETGHRKEKVIPEFEWIKRIVVEADYNGIPVFMKDSLIPIVGEKNMRRDYPKELQIRKRSEKVNKKLSGNCMLCGKTEDKNKMVTLTARAVRGGKATSFGHMCHSCFAKWLTSHNIPVPDLENKKEIEDGKEKL